MCINKFLNSHKFTSSLCLLLHQGLELLSKDRGGGHDKWTESEHIIAYRLCLSGFPLKNTLPLNRNKVKQNVPFGYFWKLLWVYVYLFLFFSISHIRVLGGGPLFMESPNLSYRAERITDWISATANSITKVMRKSN